MDDKRAVVPLIGALKDNDSAVRSKAAFDLGNLGDIHEEDPLIRALKDEDEVVEANASSPWALSGITGLFNR